MRDGVTKYKKTQYRADIIRGYGPNVTTEFLGIFKTKAEAEAAYKAAYKAPDFAAKSTPTNQDLCGFVPPGHTV